jgi:hypothetical protein
MSIEKSRLLRIIFIALLTGSSVILPQLLSKTSQTVVNARSTKVSNQYVGTWKGDGVQDNGGKWSILIAITPGKVNSVVGTIAYPSLSCGGELILRRVGERSIALFENLSYLGSNCISGGMVVLKPTSSSDRLEYNWFYPDGKLGGKGSIKKIDSTLSKSYKIKEGI